MKNISNLLLVFFILTAAAGYGLYTYKGWTIGLILLFAGVIMSASALIMKKEINLWAQKKSGGTLSRKEIHFLEHAFALRRYLPPGREKDFYRKVHLFMLDKEFIGQNKSQKAFPPAVLLCGAYASFFDPDARLRVPLPSSPVYVFYDHPFPSPAIHKHLHITEYHKEDGAFLFSIPHLMKGNEAPDRFLNIVLYETVNAAGSNLISTTAVPPLETLCRFGGYTLPRLEEYIGLPRDLIDPAALAVTLYFVNPARFQNAFPEAGEQLSEIFRAHEAHPTEKSQTV